MFTKLVRAIAAAFALGIAAPAVAGNVWFVAPPNGVDDTDAIQMALNECIGATANCIVQLDDGVYLSRQLITYDFHGTLRGRGKNRTTLQALPTLPLAADFNEENFSIPPSVGSPWPDFLTFVDGDIQIADFSLKVTEIPATELWSIFGLPVNVMISALRVQGTQPLRLRVDRVHMEGVPQSDSPWAFNLANCMILAGEQPKPVQVGDFKQDRYQLSGEISVRNSSFANCGYASGVGAFDGGRINISRNTFDNVLFALDFETIEDGIVFAERNSGNALIAGLYMASVWHYAAEVPSWYLIRHNEIEVLPTPFAWNGAVLLDNVGETKVLDATLAHNRFEIFGWAGIELSDTKGVRLIRNNVVGAGASGILVSASSECLVLANDVSSFEPMPDYGRIYLDSGTTHCLVVGGHDAGDVVDKGEENVVITFPPR